MMASSAVLYNTQGNVAVLTMNNPPVNALSSNVRHGLFDGLQRALKDNSVKCIIITGKGKAFCAGADITEFSAQTRAPAITQIGDIIESSNKPVIAAIHGFAFGGGLELALFCHYRIVTKNTRVAFPEVLLGILPGAAGTQRLPRVAPLGVAMEMIASGQPISAHEAVKYRIVDKIVDGDLIKEAGNFLKYINAGADSLHMRRLRDQPVRDVQMKDKIYEEALAKVTRRAKGFIAPVYCLKAVKSAAELPYAEGLKRERELFMQLMGSGQARALQYAFFCERAVSKWQLPSGENQASAKPLPIRSVAVVGTGTMGTGIAVALISSGFPTLVMDQNEKLLKRGVEMIKSLIEGGVKLGKRTDQQAKTALSLLKPVTRLEDLKDVDLVIEAVFENMDIKQDMFKKLDSVCKPETVLCSNTSSLNIDKIAEATKRPDKVIGCHFFVPAYHMRLLENIYGKKTSGTTAATAMELGRRLNKITVLVGNCHGFCANRLHGLMSHESHYLVEEGATPERVDKVQEDFGLPIGIFKVADLSGVDIGWRIRQGVLKNAGLESKPGARIQFLNGKRYSTLSDELYERGRLGRKTGKGWYMYDKPGSKVPYPDEEVTDIIRKYCQENKMERRTITTQEIIERCVYSVINEGFRLIEEKIVSRPEEIDTCWLHGFGWPRYLGGPMFYAQQVGLKRIYERVCHYQRMLPAVEHWQPSELLKRMAERNEPMKNWVVETPTQSRL